VILETRQQLPNQAGAGNGAMAFLFQVGRLRRAVPDLGRSYGALVVLDLRGISGHILARMAYEIILAPEAIEDLRWLRAVDRTSITDAIQEHLRYEPKKESRSRIKRLRGLRQPEYRLRVGEFRVFYDIVEPEVHILAIVSKEDADEWLNRHGTTL
jgi:mRNA interferase RelE/StbE